ncbi:MAG: hypothetical protein MUO63_12200 [Desulfobulbaceae bacterium]|nr:hypothetical protein [Desulfobulbaceae bacterium]
MGRAAAYRPLGGLAAGAGQQPTGPAFQAPLLGGDCCDEDRVGRHYKTAALPPSLEFRTASKRRKSGWGIWGHAAFSECSSHKIKSGRSRILRFGSAGLSHPPTEIIEERTDELLSCISDALSEMPRTGVAPGRYSATGRIAQGPRAAEIGSGSDG